MAESTKPKVSNSVNGLNREMNNEVLEALRQAISNSGYVIFSTSHFIEKNPSGSGGLREVAHA